MFHHVYLDLVFLANSKELNKSAFDMQKHYLELKCFLEEMEQYPEAITKCHHEVFISETRLYSGDLNHRKHKHKCTPFNCIQESLFFNLPKDRTLLFSKVVAGAISMKEKLCVYAADFLPNGRYWNPDTNIAAVLKDLDPSNDLCKSMFGLNDYLCTALPNMLQITKSNLIEMKNHTMKWFNKLPQERQEFIIDLVVKNRTYITNKYKEEQQYLSKRRQDAMLKQKEKRELSKARQAAEKDKLAKLHLVSSVAEFDHIIAKIKETGLSVKKKISKF